MKLEILGAAFSLLLAAPAFSQSPMKIEVPFSYRIGNTELPAGKYTVGPGANVKNVVLFNDGRNLKMAMGTIAYGEAHRPRLVFSCTDASGCTLIKSWGDNGVAVQFAKPKPSLAGNERAVVIYPGPSAGASEQ